MKVVFNTGRLYQPDGQIITATYEPATHRVLFMDHSRCIAGEILNRSPITTEAELMAHAMLHYDLNQYRMSMEAMQLSRDPRVDPVRFKV